MWLFVPLPRLLLAPDPSPPVRQQCIGRIFGNASGTDCCLLPAALQPRRFCQFSVTLMGLIIFELCSCTVFFSSIFFVFYFTYFVGLTIHKFVFEVGPKGRRQPGEKNHCCCCRVVVAGTCCCRCSCRCCCSCCCKVPIVVAAAAACDVLCHCLISF